MFDFKNLRQGREEILKNRYRVRLLKKYSIPIVCNIPGFEDDVLVIDLPEAEGYEAQMLKAQKERQQLLSERLKSSEVMSNKENLPIGCELRGEPLKITFMSIAKLDEMAAANKTRMDEDGFEITAVPHRFANFDLHLIPQCEAHDLINDLTLQKFDAPVHLSSISIFIFTEGIGNEKLLLLGMRRTSTHLTTFKGCFFDSFYSSINTLEQYGAYFLHHFLLQTIKCYCQFDLLCNNLLVDKGLNNKHAFSDNSSGNFIPAKFVIETEWILEECDNKEPSIERKPQMNNYLALPPNEAVAELKFKPGWMDARIALTDRIKELRHLAELAGYLKSNISPWDKNKVDDQSNFIIDRLKELIVSAKNKLESQPIFPFDFTDRLWDILKIVKSTDTLRQAFQLIYDELQTGKFIVLVGTNKVSSLAKMLRQRNLDEMIFPRLEAMTCLQFLCEIGVDRFYAELVYRLNGLLAMTFDLNPYLLRSTAPIEDKIERLLSLYLALQSMIVIKEHTRLQQHENTNITKRLLDHFIALKGTEPFEKEFIYKVKIGDTIREKIDSEAICDWILERTYKKYTKLYTDSGPTFSSGPISDVIYISKHLGIKYLHSINKPEHEMSETMNNIKQEVFSPILQKETITTNLPDNNIDKRKTHEEQKNNQNAKVQKYECLHLTSTCQPITLFV